MNLFLMVAWVALAIAYAVDWGKGESVHPFIPMLLCLVLAWSRFGEVAA